MADTIYILLGLNAEGAIPAMELISCGRPDEAVARARAWLTSHASCVRVQVWAEDDTLLADLGREPSRRSSRPPAPPVSASPRS